MAAGQRRAFLLGVVAALAVVFTVQEVRHTLGGWSLARRGEVLDSSVDIDWQPQTRAQQRQQAATQPLRTQLQPRVQVQAQQQQVQVPQQVLQDRIAQFRSLHPTTNTPTPPSLSSTPSSSPSPSPFVYPKRPTISMNRRTSPKPGSTINTVWVSSSKKPRTLGEMTDEAFSALPREDVFKEVKYGSCAVVGSAGLLKHEPRGAEIDSHDAVFRFNLAPVKGHERYAGSKTTIRLVNRLHFGFRETPSESVLQHVTISDTWRQFVRLKRRNRDMRTYAIDREFYKHVVTEEMQQPTNGYFGLNLALLLCEKVDVYGFLRSWRGWVPYHYFDSEEPNDRQQPRDNSEMPMIEGLIRKHAGRMSFKHQCIIDTLCEGCSQAAYCNGQAPYPVPKLGFCKVRDAVGCFVRCRDDEGEACATGKEGFCSSTQDNRPCIESAPATSLTVTN